MAQTSLSTTPRNGRLAALGIGAGGLVFAVAATVGLGAVIAYAGPVFLSAKIAGGLNLAYLGVQLWRSSGGGRSDADHTAPPSRRTFVTAMLTQLSNPKAIIVYGSVFATALPVHPALWLLFALPLTVTFVEATWYLLIATVMSRPGPRRAYSRAAKTLDRCAGIIMGGLGAAFTGEGLRTAVR
ncbi:LysE family transporter [Mycobacterium sp. WMMD1722]|uniref:LysE family transporter n=1 Tax=Mycobacterium sp. WMMD1722 TaxID=3404117 RepID=UPI003BF4F510